ncbi:MAG: hypothetical protein K2G67_04540 [Muribaculaceae bacterium]|nr:hypothetical protein [Muribaculaceae bacterium]
MKKLTISAIGVLLLSLGTGKSMADYPVAVHGSVQADIVFPEIDEAINAVGPYSHKMLFNTYADVNLASRYVDAGIRAEFMKWPIPGYEDDFAGWGLSNFYVKGKYKGFDLTIGDFYEQFGSGFILRTYENRALGIDNAIRGGRFNINAVRGLRLTMLGGVQRVYWDWSKKSQIYGANAELYMQDYIPAISDRNATWMIGGSYVLKHESDEDIFIPETNYRLNLPKYVNSLDVRSSFSKGPWSVLGEFAWKGQDPSYNNDYTYGTGTAYFLSGSFSKKGISAMLQAKRSYNMSFRSQRSRDGIAAFINNMPAFTYTHTYSLPALYPYATQNAPGEWAYQGQFSYNFPRKSKLGGRYGTKITLNASYVSSLVHEAAPEGLGGNIMGTDGARPVSNFFAMGSCNYYDINLQVEKRFSAPLTMTFMYMNQLFNNEVGKIVETDEKYIRTNIIVADAKYRINKKFTLRGELQYLFTKQDQKDWAYGLVEFSWSPYLMVSASDMWNCGETGTHYYMFGVAGTYRSNRLMLSYGRTRAGFDCSGGLCRPVPPMHGFKINYTFNF